MTARQVPGTDSSPVRHRQVEARGEDVEDTQVELEDDARWSQESVLLLAVALLPLLLAVSALLVG